MQPEVTVIVVTWNARDHLEPCLEAVCGLGGAGVDLQVVLVDNGSTDGTAAHVRSMHPQVEVIETGRNGGMAAGNNAGMLAASGRAFLLLNSDAYLEPGALRVMLDRLATEPAGTVAAVAPRLLNADRSAQRSVRGFPTLWRYATEFLYVRRLAPRLRAANAFYGAGVDLRKPGRVDWATGACLLVPRDAVDAVGLMDEAYFMYGEEVDWFLRMRHAGRHVAWEPRAGAIHLGGGSARSEWGRLYGLQLANHVRLMARAHGTASARRTRRLLLGALAMRASVWGVAARLPFPGDRSARARRAEAFRAGASRVAAVDPAAVGAPVIPAWTPLQHGADGSR